MFGRFTHLLIPILGVIILGVQACSRQLNPQDSCNFVQNPEKQRVSWKTQEPIKIYVHKSLPVEAYASLQYAMDVFDKNFGRQVFRVIAWGVDTPSGPGRDGYSAIFWMNQWDPNRPSEQARTTIYWAGAQIYEADIRINAANFQFYFGDALAFSQVDLTSIFVHELGHVLGLAHTPTIGSVMNYSLSNGQVRRTLSKTDIGDLRCEY